MVRWYIALAGALALLVPGVALAGSPDATATVTEGHTSYVVLEFSKDAPAPVLGTLTCEVRLLGIALGVDDVSRCRERHVFATPSPFPAPGPKASLTPTGRERTHVDDGGVAWTTRELTYPLRDGTTAVTFATEAGPRATDGDDGETYNFVVALPPLPGDGGWRSFSVTPGALD